MNVQMVPSVTESEAWAVDDLAVLFCKGKVVKVCNEWQGPQSVRI